MGGGAGVVDWIISTKAASLFFLVDISGFTTSGRNVPLSWLRNCAPTSSTYFGELRKQ